jgi:hypothetical protein
MQALIIHPTAATAIPVTHIAAGKSGKARKVKAQRDMTRDDLVILVQAAGLRPLTKHTKTELRLMLTTGQQVRPAAQDRANAQRKAKRVTKKAA